METFYFNKTEALNFIHNHTYDEIKSEIENTNNKAQEYMRKWSIIDDAKDIVLSVMPDVTLEDENDNYWQAKSIFASQFVEYMKYIEFLQNNL